MNPDASIPGSARGLGVGAGVGGVGDAVVGVNVGASDGASVGAWVGAGCDVVREVHVPVGQLSDKDIETIIRCESSNNVMTFRSSLLKNAILTAVAVSLVPIAHYCIRRSNLGCRDRGLS